MKEKQATGALARGSTGELPAHVEAVLSKGGHHTSRIPTGVVLEEEKLLLLFQRQLLKSLPHIYISDQDMLLSDGEERLLAKDRGSSRDPSRGEGTPSFSWRGLQLERRVGGQRKLVISWTG